MRTTWILVLAVIATGCLGERLERNAPGIVNLDEPPADPTEPEKPGDPGLQAITFAVGPTFSGGPGWGSEPGMGGFGVETSVFYGVWRDGERAGDSFPWVIPETSIGLAGGGWFPFHNDQVWFGELRVRALTLGLGLGWAFEEPAGTSGPQASLSFTPLFVRGRTTGHGGTFEFGVALTPSYSIIWSR